MTSNFEIHKFWPKTLQIQGFLKKIKLVQLSIPLNKLPWKTKVKIDRLKKDKQYLNSLQRNLSKRTDIPEDPIHMQAKSLHRSRAEVVPSLEQVI